MKEDNEELAQKILKKFEEYKPWGDELVLARAELKRKKEKRFLLEKLVLIQLEHSNCDSGCRICTQIDETLVNLYARIIESADEV